MFGFWGDDTPPLPEPSDRVVLKNGAKFFETSGHVIMDADIVPTIVFLQGCPTVRWRPVVYTLRGITEHVLEIVESFVPEFS